MAASTVKAEDFFKEIGFGEVKVKVVDGKLFSIPKQIIERPGKAGISAHFVVHEPIQLE